MGLLSRGPSSLLCVLALAAASCTRDDPAPGGPAAVPGPGTTEEPNDGSLEALVSRTERAFIEQDGGFVARGTDQARFSSRVGADGAITFRPSARTKPTLTLRTVASTRADARLARDRGEVTVTRDAAVEHIRNTGAGIEQSWTFSTRPALTPSVRVAVSGMRWVAETSTGQHFVDDATGIGVRYGTATWIDAAGRSAAIPVEREGAELVIRVPADLAEGPYPATIDPVLSAEQGLDQPVDEPAGTVSSIHLAPGPSDGFLAAFVDDGNDETSPARVVRIGSDGKPIGAAITVMPDADSVAVAWDGQRWLVVTASATKGARFARVAANGALLDATPKALAPAANTVDVAYDGTKFVAVWSSATYNTPAPIELLRIDGAAGTFDAATKVTVAPTTSGSTTPRVACAAPATGCGVFYGGSFVRVSNANAVLDATPIAIGTSSQYSALTTDGTQWLAYWEEQSGKKVSTISATGTVGTPLTVDTSSNAHPIGVTFDGTNFVTTWRQFTFSVGDTIYGRRVAPNGAFVDSSRISMQTTVRNAAFAASGAARVLAFTAASNTYPILAQPLYTRPFTATLTPSAAAVPATFGKNQQTAPIAAYSGTTFLVLWTDNRSTPGAGTYAARLSSTGAPIDTVGTKVDTADAVASDGNGFLSVHDTGTRIEARRFGGASSTSLDSSPIVVANDTSYDAPRVAFDGKNYVVVWSSNKTGPLTSRDIRAARVTAAGAVLDPEGFIVTSAGDWQGAPSIASDGKGSLVVWEDYKIDWNYGDIFGARIDQNGTVLDTPSLAIAKHALGQYYPTVAPNGTGYTVLWWDERPSPAEGLYATRVSSTGAVDAAPFFVAGGSYNLDPIIADMQDGVSQMVGWTSGRPMGTWLRGQPLELLDAKPVQISPEPGLAGGLSLVPAGPGRMAAFYWRFVDAIRATRVFVRMITSGSAAGATCAAVDECQSRWCREGACCKERCDGACSRCAAATGACEKVVSADDADTCTGDKTCDATGACKKKNGSVCETATECASAFCVDSFCCDKACDGACEGCAENRGTCTPLARGSLGTPSCSPNRCDGVSAACSAQCLTDGECADGFGCDRPTKSCISGAVCSDVATVRNIGGGSQTCRPYACNAGRCNETCKSVSDCAFPAACDESGHCVTATDDSSFFCSAVPTRRAGANDVAGIAGVALALATALRRRRARA